MATVGSCRRFSSSGRRGPSAKLLLPAGLASPAAAARGEQQPRRGRVAEPDRYIVNDEIDKAGQVMKTIKDQPQGRRSQVTMAWLHVARVGTSTISPGGVTHQQRAGHDDEVIGRERRPCPSFSFTALFQNLLLRTRRSGRSPPSRDGAGRRCTAGTRRRRRRRCAGGGAAAKRHAHGRSWPLGPGPLRAGLRPRARWPTGYM